MIESLGSNEETIDKPVSVQWKLSFKLLSEICRCFRSDRALTRRGVFAEPNAVVAAFTPTTPTSASTIMDPRTHCEPSAMVGSILAIDRSFSASSRTFPWSPRAAFLGCAGRALGLPLACVISRSFTAVSSLKYDSDSPKDKVDQSRIRRGLCPHLH